MELGLREAFLEPIAIVRCGLTTLVEEGRLWWPDSRFFKKRRYQNHNYHK